MNYLKHSSRNEFQSELGRLLEDFWGPQNFETSSKWAPLADIDEEKDHFLVSLEIPGMKKEDLKIEAHGDRLMISGERKSEETGKGGRYSERRYGSFQRAFTLPTQVDSSRIEANYEDGVLKIYVPKSELARSRQIKVGDGSQPGSFFGKLLGGKETKSA